ncbi:hypothetical protein ACHQM5_026073 [Ranunculus cassubicifolius]
MAAKDAEGRPTEWLDAFVELRERIPDAQQIAENYRRLLDERYPEGTHRPSLDHELWERAQVVKKNCVRGIGTKRRATSTPASSSVTGGSSSFASNAPATSSQHTTTTVGAPPVPYTPADCVRALCEDLTLMQQFAQSLRSSLGAEEAAAVVAIVEQSLDRNVQLSDDADS